jgi:hypothetical protein
MVAALMADVLLGMDVLLYGGPMAGIVEGKDVILMDVLDELRVIEVVVLTGRAGVRAGVGGPEDAGEGFSTTHILFFVRSFENK